MPLDDSQFKLLLERLDKQDDKLDVMHGDFREFKGTLATKVKNIEKQTDSDRFWNRVQTVAVIPVVIALHQLGAHFGFTKR